jgi:hypothetical protein
MKYLALAVLLTVLLALGIWAGGESTPRPVEAGVVLADSLRVSHQMLLQTDEGRDEWWGSVEHARFEEGQRILITITNLSTGRFHKGYINVTEVEPIAEPKTPTHGGGDSK